MNFVITPLEELAAQNPKFFFLWSLKNAGIAEFAYLPPGHSPLFDANRPLRLVVDQVMAPTTFLNDAWQPEELQFIKSHVRAGQKYLLVDVGANMGLVTRQIFPAIASVEGAICYEPHPANFECLRFNVSHRNVLLSNAGLGDSAATLKFYVDPANCGNYSLNSNAMTASVPEITVQVLDARAESLKWLALGASQAATIDGWLEPLSPTAARPRSEGRRFIYKSDTQGFDELIAGRVADSFWDRVDVAILELWRIDKPKFDPAAFVAVLDAFPNKVFLTNPETKISTRDVLEYLAGRDRKHDDLGMWR